MNELEDWIYYDETWDEDDEEDVAFVALMLHSVTDVAAGVAKLANAADLKSVAFSRACGFEPRLRHQT